MYPEGQAEAGVTAQVVAKTAMSSPTILIVRMTVSFAAMPLFAAASCTVQSAMCF
jgi:hypothetical protein